MDIQPYHIVDFKGVPVLLNIEKLKTFTLDKTRHALLKGLLKTPAPQLSEDAATALRAFDLVSPLRQEGRKKVQSDAAAPSFQRITLLVTQPCNFRCVYCYGDGGEYGSAGDMTEKTAFQTLDWFIAQSGNHRELTLSFFGGEPLLNLPLVKKAIDYAETRGRASGKTFGFGITTNGSLLDEASIALFKEKNVAPMVSFDGPKELQDAQRPFKNGKGSHDIVFPRLRRLISEFPDALCRATLTGMADPLQVKRYLHGIGFSAVQIIPAAPTLPWRNQQRENMPRNIPGMLAYIESCAEELLESVKNRDTARLRCLRRSDGLCELLDQFIHHRRKTLPCGAGLRFAAVSCSGEIFLCQRFVGIEAHKLGDVFKGCLTRDVPAEKTADAPRKFSQCFARNTCAGGCYYGNMAATGSLCEPDDQVCILMKRATEVGAWIAALLDEEDRSYLMRECLISNRPKLCPLDFPSSNQRFKSRSKPDLQ